MPGRSNKVTASPSPALSTSHLVVGYAFLALLVLLAWRLAPSRRLDPTAGLTLPRSLIANGFYTFETGVAAANRLLDLSPRPTAIFASNDEMAAGVVHAAHHRGIVVPRDLSVVGFDDTPVAAHIWPPLTTVRWPLVSAID